MIPMCYVNDSMTKAKTIIVAFFIVLLTATTADAKSIIRIGRDATIAENQIIKNIVILGGQITVSGLVENNVIALGGSIVLTGKSVVRGNVLCLGGVVVRGSGSQVFGKITEINSSNITATLRSFFLGEDDAWSAVLNIIFLFFQGIIFVLAMLLAFLSPNSLTTLKNSIQNNKMKSFLWGLLITASITPFFILLVISVIGIYLIPLLFIALVAAFMLGYIAAANLLGDYVLSGMFSSHKKSPVKETVSGLILLLALGWLPYVGWLIKIIALTIGFGGVLLLMFGHRHRRQASA